MNKRRIAVIDENIHHQEKIKNLLATTDAELFAITDTQYCSASLLGIKPDLIVVTITPALIQDEGRLRQILKDDPLLSKQIGRAHV